MHPPTPPTPPAPPSMPPMPSAPPTPAASEGQASEQKDMDIDQEREAILRMIAEGRVTPEEGDLLLEALED